MPIIAPGGSTSTTELRLEISIPFAVTGASMRVRRNGIEIGIASSLTSTTFEYTDTSVPAGSVSYVARIQLGSEFEDSDPYTITRT